MKKLTFLITLFLLLILPSNAFVDRYSKEYLQSKKHFAIINPIVENAVEAAIKKELKKQTGAKFNVKFDGYTTSSMKKGIFKYLEISGKNPKVDGVPLEYAHLRTLTDYNYIDYKQSPVVYKSDMTFAFDIILSEESLNAALDDNKYKKVTDKVNKLASPFFTIEKVQTKIRQNKLYMVIDYNFPVARSSVNRTFITSSDLKVQNGKIVAKNVYYDSKYGNLGITRVANLMNLLNPLEFTLQLMDAKNCKGNVENVNIVDNKIKVDGKIFVSGDEQ